MVTDSHPYELIIPSPSSVSKSVEEAYIKGLLCIFLFISQLGVGGNDVLKNMLLTLMEYKFYLRDTTSP
jgi:hypothetical protein